MKKIKLRRDWQGQDSWGAFLEEVGIETDDGQIVYRRSTGGNCNYGRWQEWEDEATALVFLLGPLKISPQLRAQLYNALNKAPDLSEVDLMRGSSDDCNYGAY